MSFVSRNAAEALAMRHESDMRVRLEQVRQGADMMALALRSDGTDNGEMLARIVESVAVVAEGRK